MKNRTLYVILCLGVLGSAAAGQSPPSAGGGGSNVLAGGRDVCWSEAPNLEGLLGSSEIAGQLGVETELANDFLPVDSGLITLARWWGGSWGGNGCGDHHLSSTWNLRFYDDSGCLPGALLAEYVVGDFAGETFIYCQNGFYPIFVYEASVSVPVTASVQLWFGAQAGDHGTIEPFMGRLAAAAVTGCDTAFRSAYYGYPNWVAAETVFGVPYDASQEFECELADPILPVSWGSLRTLFR